MSSNSKKPVHKEYFTSFSFRRGGGRPPSGRSDGPKKFGGRNRNQKRDGKIRFPREEDRPKRKKQPSYPLYILYKSAPAATNTITVARVKPVLSIPLG